MARRLKRFKKRIDGNGRNRRSLFYGVTSNVLLLGLASFFADLSSEMITPILPLFIATLGGTGLMVGLIGGLSDSMISISKILSGYYSDKLGKRKGLVLAGYSFSAFAKLFMAFATNSYHLLILRPVERIGKGIREPPRDALVGETTPKRIRGKIFGVIKAMDTFGALLGSLLVLVLMYRWNMGFKSIFLIAGIVALVSIISLFFIKDVKKKPFKAGLIKGLEGLPKNFRTYLGIATIFAIADFSYMFFILKAQDHFSSYLIPVMLYVLFNIVYALLAFPLGILSDRIGRKKVLSYGYIMFIATCISFIYASSMASFIASFALYGLTYALLVGNERAFASDLAPRKEMGTALGTFHTFIALATLPASLIAGYLWQYQSHGAPFVFGAVMCSFALIALLAAKNLDGR